MHQMTSFEDGLPSSRLGRSGISGKSFNSDDAMQWRSRIDACIAGAHALLMAAGIVGMLVMAIWG